MKNKEKVLKNEKGTTLVEIMLSVALLAIIAAPLLGAVYSSVKNNSTAKNKTEAVALAERVMGEIKAQEVIGSTTKPVELPDANGLVASYEISLDDRGNVALSTASESSNSSIDNSEYTYDANAANSADFVLEITQGDSGDHEVTVILKGSDGSLLHTYTDLLVDRESLDLKVNQSTGYTLKRGSTETSGSFPNNNNIKLKVKYTDTTPSKAEQLKINTHVIPSDPQNTSNGDVFKVYVIDNEEVNSGVKFINIGTTDFEVIYMDSDTFYYSTAINGLFKINVTIKKNGKPIYNTLSYVKK